MLNTPPNTLPSPERTRTPASRATRQLAIAIAVAAAPLVASGQHDLYSNGHRQTDNPGLSTGSVTESGVNARSGYSWSELQADTTGTSNALLALSAHTLDATRGYRVADDFVVSVQGGWIIENIAVYAYQPGAGLVINDLVPTPYAITYSDAFAHLQFDPALEFQQSPTPFPGPVPISPFTSVNLRIWDGPPDLDASAVIWGDTVTNVLERSTNANMFRIANSTTTPIDGPPNEVRLIWRTQLNLNNLVLSPGTYWLDWQYNTSGVNREAFSPLVAKPDLRTQANWNAKFFDATTGWRDAVDSGKPASAADVALAMPFIIHGRLAEPPCAADFDANGRVDSDDYFDFLNAFFAGNADFNGDGFTNSTDYFEFLNAFFTPCPTVQPIDPNVRPVDPDTLTSGN